MRASPYDLSDLGYEPVRIETPEGKQEYAAAQREFAERGAPLRQRLIEECERLLARRELGRRSGQPEADRLGGLAADLQLEGDRPSSFDVLRVGEGQDDRACWRRARSVPGARVVDALEDLVLLDVEPRLRARAGRRPR